MNRILLILFLGVACTSPTKKIQQSFTKLEYASTFEIRQSSDVLQLVNTEPWPKAKQEKAFTMTEPLKRIVCTSTSHLPYFEMLGSVEAVIGFPNTQFVSSDVFNDRIEKGLITNIGSGSTLNMELLVGMQPDAVIAFDAGGGSNSLNKIAELGIPVIYNSDFLEQTPLGRAEYIKFFGALLGKEREADSIFKTIEKEYYRVKALAANETEKPTIMSGTVYGDTWFLPGGNNWSANFYADAGGHYLWRQDTVSGWLELSFEAVYEKAYEADFWIGMATIESKEELLGQDSRYKAFAAFQKNNIYNYNKKKGPNGGVDFFESAYARPDLVLSDLIKILHPEVLPNYETVYFQKLP